MMKTFVVIPNSALVGLEMAVCQIRTLEFIQAQYRNFFSQKQIFTFTAVYVYDTHYVLQSKTSGNMAPLFCGMRTVFLPAGSRSNVIL